MLISNPEEIWRKITPEEKIDALNKSHAYGLLSSVIFIIICAAVSVGLRSKYLFWTALISSPMIFQFFSSRVWRDVKPRLILRYLAVRSVVRRFAFSAQSRSLEPELIFEGIVKEVPADTNDIEGVTQTLHHEDEYEVWVALFEDTIVMFKESKGGGQLVFSAPINEKLICEYPDDIKQKNYQEVLESEVKLQYTERREMTNIFYLRSKQPASFVVFIGKLNAIINTPKVSLTENAPENFFENSLNNR